MRMKKWSPTLRTAAALGAVLLVGNARGQSIGINFGADDAGGTGGFAALDPAATAGAISQANWNNAEGAAGNLSGLLDASGAATGVNVSWDAEESWSGAGGQPATDNGVLVNSWISENAGTEDPSTVSITGIPYSNYDLIFYIGHDRGGDGEDSVLSETGGAFDTVTVLENVTGATVAEDPFAFVPVNFSGDQGNFYIAPGLTQSSLNIELGVGTGARAPIAAIQLVEAVDAIAGDVNGDGQVDMEDYDIIEANMLQTVTGRAEGDLNFDFVVDFSDFRIWKANAGAAAGFVTPEPTGLLLAGVGGLGLMLSVRTRRRFASKAALCVVAVALAPALADAQSVGINFGADDAGGTGGFAELASTDTAGVVPQANWNNAFGISGSIAGAVDATGAATTINVEWEAEESWSGGNGGPPTTGDGVLLNSWVSENAGVEGPSTFNVTGIPYDTYDLYVYVGHDRTEDDSIFSEAGGAFTDFVTLEGIDGNTIVNDPFVFTEIATSGDVGTHFVVRALTQSTLNIELSAGTATADRAPLSGIQIVENNFAFGDVNLDGNVDLEDLDIIRGNFFMTEAVLSDGDINLDRVVDWADFKLWKANATVSTTGAVIPEPTSIFLCVGVAFGIAGRARRGG